MNNPFKEIRWEAEGCGSGTKVLGTTPVTSGSGIFEISLRSSQLEWSPQSSGFGTCDAVDVRLVITNVNDVVSAPAVVRVKTYSFSSRPPVGHRPSAKIPWVGKKTSG